MKYLKTYIKLKEGYQKFLLNRSECNPIKHSFDLECNEQYPITKSVNVMSAKTQKGVLSKTIAIDDKTGKSIEHIIYVKNDMTPVYVTNVGLTTIRCALMACLSLETLMDVKNKPKVGFIGNGKINLKTAECMNDLFGITEIVIRGSSKDFYKNKEQFERIKDMKVEVDATPDYSLLNKCDVIVTCTSSTKVEDTISIKQLNKPKLFIAQDCGYLLDSSFRENYISLSDHAEQLFAHFREEFPFDKEVISPIQMNKKWSKSKSKKVVYLYGIAFADAIIFEELFNI